MSLREYFRWTPLFLAFAGAAACQAEVGPAETQNVDLSPSFDLAWSSAEDPGAVLAVDPKMGVWTVSLDGVLRHYGEGGELLAETVLGAFDGWPMVVAGPDEGVYVAAEIQSEEHESVLWAIDDEAQVRWTARWPGFSVQDCATNERGEVIVGGDDERGEEPVGWIGVVTPDGEVRRQIRFDDGPRRVRRVAALGDIVFAAVVPPQLVRVAPDGTEIGLLEVGDAPVDQVASVGGSIVALGGGQSGRRVAGWNADGELQWEHQTAEWGLRPSRPWSLGSAGPHYALVAATYHSADGSLSDALGTLQMFAADGREVSSARITADGKNIILDTAAGYCVQDGLCRIAARGGVHEEESVFFLNAYDLDVGMDTLEE